MRRATDGDDLYTLPLTHFYPRSPCGERLVNGVGLLSCFANFYPRSPCGERHNTRNNCIDYCDFYPRSPCGERPNGCAAVPNFRNFYPRSPCGERQSSRCRWFEVVHYFYPRSPCGERQRLGLLGWLRVLISIHALLAESDGIIDIIDNVINDFYPRSPCGERPGALFFAYGQPYFYPRSPCGERPYIMTIIICTA